ncbi:MAG: CTP-dependent riboflavin kinase [Candidatus Bathyarchaeota archaeon]|nr:CTP-dependent riboflavin kinase [Candidatus Bathyarchaeota archaeon]
MTKKTFIIKGKVFSGKSEAARFLELAWVRSQIASKVGFTPFSGTLNLKIPEENITRKLLEEHNPSCIQPSEGYCRAKCLKARVGTVKCAIIVPEIASYPSDMLEIIAPVNLREKLSLKDGDTLEVKVTS